MEKLLLSLGLHSGHSLEDIFGSAFDDLRLALRHDAGCLLVTSLEGRLIDREVAPSKAVEE